MAELRIEGFVIHLARAGERRAQVDRLLETLPLTTHVLDAVDGRTLAPQTRERFARRHLQRPFYPFKLREAEIGCFLSHRQAWAQIIDRNLDAGLIVEDDVEIDPERFAPALAFAADAIEDGDYLRFPVKARESGPELARSEALAIVRPRVVGLGMQVQLVTRGAAGRLLAATQAFDRPVDTTLQILRVPGLRVLTSRPAFVGERSAALGGTTVQKKRKGAAEIVSREVARALYRLAIRLGSLRPRRESA